MFFNKKRNLLTEKIDIYIYIYIYIYKEKKEKKKRVIFSLIYTAYNSRQLSYHKKWWMQST